MYFSRICNRLDDNGCFRLRDAWFSSERKWKGPFSSASGDVEGSKPCGIDFLGGVSYNYSITLSSVSVTVSEFTDDSTSHEIMSSQKVEIFGFFGKMTPLENFVSIETPQRHFLTRNRVE